tara:strand:- start:2174 stop:2491 length:318 start_codon:yes stop_codon:yes gene_type:complete
MKPSAEFFLCFSKASQVREDFYISKIDSSFSKHLQVPVIFCFLQDNDLGTRSLHGCMTEMKEYDACMEHHYKLNPHLLIRRPPPPPLEKKVSPLEQLNNNGKKGM